MSKLTARHRRIARQARVENARNERHSGAGSQYDYGAMNNPGPGEWLSATEQDRMALTLYHRDWAAKKIVSIPVDDMFREGWGFEGLGEEQTEALENAQNELQVLQVFRQAKRLENLLGGAAIFLGVSDGTTDASLPLDPATVQPGALKFLNVIPRSRVSRVEYDTNPLTAGYGRPVQYYIQGQRVHRSRLILFTGDPLLPMPDSTIAWSGIDRGDGFGYSKLLAIMDDLTRATGSRQAAFQLVQRAGVFFAQLEADGMDGTEASDSRMAQLQNIVNQINAFRGAVFTTEPGQTFPPISSITPTFGSVPELVMSFLQILSAAADIPATRFLGQAPGGLNATGESDLENYYGRLESEQRQVLKPQLHQLMRVLIPSAVGGGVDPRKVDITFKPLWSMSAKEEAETRKIEADTIVALVTASILTTDEGATQAVDRDIITVPIIGPRDEMVTEEPAAPPLEQSLAQML